MPPLAAQRDTRTVKAGFTRSCLLAKLFEESSESNGYSEIIHHDSRISLSSLDIAVSKLHVIERTFKLYQSRPGSSSTSFCPGAVCGDRAIQVNVANWRRTGDATRYGKMKLRRIACAWKNHAFVARAHCIPQRVVIKHLSLLVEKLAKSVRE